MTFSSSPWERLIHRSLHSEIARTQRERRGFQSLLWQGLHELSTDPENRKHKLMWGIRDPNWHGTVRRILPGSRQDYRLIYWIVEEHARVMPVYLSPVTRSEGFDYSWDEWSSRFFEIFGLYFADHYEFGRDARRYRHFIPWPGETQP